MSTPEELRMAGQAQREWLKRLNVAYWEQLQPIVNAYWDERRPIDAAYLEQLKRLADGTIAVRESDRWQDWNDWE